MIRSRNIAVFVIFLVTVLLLAMQIDLMDIKAKNDKAIRNTIERLITESIENRLKETKPVNGNPSKSKSDMVEPSKSKSPPSHQSYDTAEEVRHIAFLKVHKAGSSTIQNILYRFGVARNLTFVLSTKSHYLSRRRNMYNPIVDLPQGMTKFDILCNHAAFNYEVFKKYLHDDARYFAIVRDPLELIISAAYYYRYTWPSDYLVKVNTSTFIHDILHYQERIEPDDVSRSRTFNYMTRDFGLDLQSVSYAKNITTNQYDEFLSDINDIFELVLIMERFDESLILLKRRFHWTLKDILYVKNNAYDGDVSKTSSKSLTSSDLEAFHKNYWMDIGIYEHFTKRFNEQIGNEKDIQDEVQCFKSLLREVQTFCTSRSTGKDKQVILNETKWSDRLTITTEDCDLMLKDELPFHKMLQQRHTDLLRS